MIYHLISILRSHSHLDLPYALDFYSTRICLSAITSLLFTIAMGPRFIKKLYELKIGQTIRMQECPLLGQLHEKKKDTPTMGGILILFSMLLSMLLWMDWTHPFTWILLITTLFLGLLGAVDDYLKLKHKNTKGLSTKKKLFFQIIFSLGLALYLVCPSSLKDNATHSIPTKMYVEEQTLDQEQEKTSYMSNFFIPFFKKPIVLSGIGIGFLVLFIVFVVCGSTNAVNLTDGLDGLAAGSIILVALTLSLVAFVTNHVGVAKYLNIIYIEGSGEISIYLCALAGGCLGFLWYNGHPAQVFMGDTGSLALGGVIGVSAVLLRREFLLAIIGGIFVIEALSVILQVMSYRMRNKKRIFLCSPIHHHFEYKGWPETKVVLRFWIVGLFFSIIGIASLKLQ